MNLEDTSLFWTTVCAQAHDITVHLGYSSGAPSWPSAPAVRNLKLHNTSFCHAADGSGKYYRDKPPKADETVGNCGSGTSDNVLVNSEILSDGT